MSTRCVINFCDGEKKNVCAKVYRHSDGYPEGVKPDLKQFFEDVRKQTKDMRFDNPSYLAAKYVVWQANDNRRVYDHVANLMKGAPGFRTQPPKEPLDFLGVGVILETPSDVQYEYYVLCGKYDADSNPKVTHRKV